MVFGGIGLWAFGGEGSILSHKEGGDEEEDIERNCFM